MVAGRGGDVLAVGLLHQLGVHAALAPVDQPGLLQPAGQLVGGLDADVGAGGHRARRQLGWKCRCPPQASSTITIACGEVACTASAIAAVLAARPS